MAYTNAAQKGKDILIQKGSGGGVVTLGGIRTKDFTINSGIVDVTTADDTNRYRQLLAATEIKHLSVSGSGVVKDTQAQQQAVTDTLAQTVDTYTLTCPGIGTFVGPFQLNPVQDGGPVQPGSNLRYRPRVRRRPHLHGRGLGVNPLRGEAEVKIGRCKFILAAEMAGLAELSSATGCKTIHELYERLIGTELLVTRRALAAFVLSGTDADGKVLKRREAAAVAVDSFSLSDIVPIQAAFVEIMSALTRKPDQVGEGDEAGNPTAAQT